ncbi:MAG: histidine kinase dimerization/phospho-acceptor domain-containing protein, partial [Pseudomonadota bacterium]
MRNFSDLSAACSSAVDRWVRDGVESDERPAQIRFVLVHLACSGAFLASVPVALVLDGAARSLAPALALFGCIGIALSLLLLRSGSLRTLRFASVFAGTAAIAWLTASMGAAAAPFAVLLALPLLEASLLHDRRLDRFSAVLAFAALGSLAWLNPSWALLAPLAVIAFAAFQVSRQRRRSLEVSAAQSSERTTRDLLTSAVPDCVGLFDTKGICINGTPGTGAFTLDLAPGRGFMERVHLQDRVAFLKLLDDSTRETVEPINVRIRDRDAGGWRDITLIAKQTAKRGVIGIVMRPPRAKVLERKVPAAQRQLLATMSHELRTPLNAIIG